MPTGFFSNNIGKAMTDRFLLVPVATGLDVKTDIAEFRHHFICDLLFSIDIYIQNTIFHIYTYLSIIGSEIINFG
jgi:hypothetical protein